MAEREGFEPSVEYNPHTRLAGEHHRPLGHLSRKIGVYPGLVAEGVGFEPTVLAHNGFQDRRLQPLGHPSKRGCSYHFAQALSTRRPRSGAVQGKFMIHTGCAAAPCPCMPFDFAIFPDTDRVAARSDQAIGKFRAGAYSGALQTGQGRSGHHGGSGLRIVQCKIRHT